MEKRLVLFLGVCAAILIGWHFLTLKLFPPQEQNKPVPAQAINNSSPQPTPAAPPPANPAQPASPSIPQTQAEVREIDISTDWWRARVSNQGAVLTLWTMTRFTTDNKEIDPQTQGVNLLSEKNSKEFGGTLRFYIPADRGLETELNSARYEIEKPAGSELRIAKGQTQEIAFLYRNSSGIEARKSLVFNGDGYDFNVSAEVKRNGQQVPIQFVIGPNFGDQTVKPTEYGIYKTPPRISYSYGGSVSRDMAASVKTAEPHRIEHPVPVTWAAIDDGYFALAFIPADKARDIHLMNVRRKETIDGTEVEQNYLSLAIPVVSGKVNRLYAGPKDLPTLEKVSKAVGLGGGSDSLVDILDYGYLSFMAGLLRPLTRLMLTGLLWIYSFTHNYGWAIVILTVAINMLFFPLRWKSSKTMKKAAALQPKMKELQDRMKKVDKNDPQMLELQREQMALMKEGNMLMGCLPMLLQMPFLMAIYLILTVSIEVRHAPFFGWMKDLSSPDPFYLLPILMCGAMILQTALTPTPPSPDPAQAQAQKMMQYVMPIMLTVLVFIRAPLGLVLYWMVGNVVGIVQQFIINKITPSVPPAPPASDESKSGKSSGSQKKEKKTGQLVTES
jgi:YidC/Oxa1 family membrane protein insertase